MTGDINIFIGDYQIEDLRLDLGCTPLQLKSELKGSGSERQASSTFSLLLVAARAERLQTVVGATLNRQDEHMSSAEATRCT